MTAPAAPCPGVCNRTWRDAENRLDHRGHAVPHQQTPVLGVPIWCPDEADAIAERVDELPHLIDLLELEVDGQPTGSGDAPVSGSRGRPSPSPVVDDIDEIARLLEYWEDAYRELADMPRRSRSSAQSTARWLAGHVAELLAAPFAEEFGRDITRLHTRALRRTATDQPKDRKPVPCPGCDLLALVHANGDKYIGCDGCGRLLSFNEYDAWARLLAAGQTTTTRRTA